MPNIVSLVSESGSDKSFASISQQLSLRSYHATQVVKRCLSKTGDALFNIAVSLRAIADPVLVDELSKLITSEFVKIKKDLERSKERTRHVLKESGVTDLVEYSNVTTYEIQVNSPQMIMLLRLLESLDELYNLNDTLWMNGLCDDQDKSRMAYDWQRRFTKMCNRIIEMHKRARAAMRAAKEKEEKAAADSSQKPKPVPKDALPEEASNELIDEIDESFPEASNG